MCMTWLIKGDLSACVTSQFNCGEPGSQGEGADIQ